MGILDKLFGNPNNAGVDDTLPADINVGARYLKDRIAPGAMQIHPKYIEVVGEYYSRTWWVEDLPRTLMYGLLTDLYDFPARIQISQLVVPMDMGEVRQALKQQRTTLQSRQIMRNKRGQITDYDEMDRVASAEQQAAEIQLKKTPPIKLFWTIGLFSIEKNELDEYSKRLEELFNHAEIRAHQAVFREEAGLHSLLPLGVNTMSNWRNVDAPSLGQMFPFVHSTLVEPNGAPYGIDRYTGAWVIANDFAEGNPNTIILGEMGSGKSVFLKNRIAWFTLLGGRTFCIDLEGEFDGVAEALGGIYLDFGLEKHTKNKLNVIGINAKSETGFIEGMEDLMAWLELVADGLSPLEKNEIMDAWMRIMTDAGIYQDQSETWTRPMPRLSDLYATLISERKEAANSIADRIKQYAVGLYSYAFNVQTTIDPQNSLVIFGLKSVRDPNMKALRLRQIISFIWQHVLTKITPTWIVVDEAWNWLQNERAAKDLENIARRFRKRYAALHLATQHVSDMSASAGATVIRDTAGVTVIFRQKSASALAAGQLFELNELEVEEIKIQSPGEALLITKGHRIPIYVPVMPELMSRFTTNPEELRQMQEMQQAGGENNAS